MYAATATTRAALLERRARIALATRGRDLLQQQRRELLRAFREIAADAIDAGTQLDAAARAARDALLLAEAEGGPGGVRSASWASHDDVHVEAQMENLLGVRVPRIEHGEVGRPRTGRGYSLAGTAPHVDRVAEHFERVVERLLAVASAELRLRRLGAAILRTTRRANALDQVVLPRLQAEARAIGFKLRQREREDQFRLRRIKAHRGG